MFFISIFCIFIFLQKQGFRPILFYSLDFGGDRSSDPLICLVCPLGRNSIHIARWQRLFINDEFLRQRTRSRTLLPRVRTGNRASKIVEVRRLFQNLMSKFSNHPREAGLVFVAPTFRQLAKSETKINNHNHMRSPVPLSEIRAPTLRRGVLWTMRVCTRTRLQIIKLC